MVFSCFDVNEDGWMKTDDRHVPSLTRKVYVNKTCRPFVSFVVRVGYNVVFNKR